MPKGNERSFYFCSNGCLRTSSGRRRIFDYLRVNGLNPTDRLPSADFVFIDTCGYHQKTEDDSMALIERVLRGKHASARAVVLGCLTKINGERVGQLDDVDVVKPGEMERLDEMIAARVPFGATRMGMIAWRPVDPEGCSSGKNPFRDISCLLPAQVFHAFRRAPIGFLRKINPPVYRRIRKGLPERARNVLIDPADIGPGVCHLEVSTGCLGRCSYCVFKFVWGRIISRPVSDIITDFKLALRRGYTLFSLDAQDLGAFGQDTGTDIVALLTALFEMEGRFRIMLHDFNPQWFIRYYPQLEDIFTRHAGKIVYLDLPVQSGSDRILGLMGRPYAAEDLLPLIDRLKSRLSDLPLEIDVMAGFPGETEHDFGQTKDFLRYLRGMKNIFVWRTDYTDRPGTESSTMPDKIDPAEIVVRMDQLMDLSARYNFFLGDGVSLIHRGMKQVVFAGDEGDEKAGRGC